MARVGKKALLGKRFCPNCGKPVVIRTDVRGRPRIYCGDVCALAYGRARWLAQHPGPRAKRRAA